MDFVLNHKGVGWYAFKNIIEPGIFEILKEGIFNIENVNRKDLRKLKTMLKEVANMPYKPISEEYKWVNWMNLIITKVNHSEFGKEKNSGITVVREVIMARLDETGPQPSDAPIHATGEGALVKSYNEPWPSIKTVKKIDQRLGQSSTQAFSSPAPKKKKWGW